ncbi:hypothetical protein IM538_18585 [Cytobacillus suaedae]|nr:hypothetical protein IM538_18585 [Cytobacillus suaedae]
MDNEKKLIQKIEQLMNSVESHPKLNLELSNLIDKAKDCSNMVNIDSISNPGHQEIDLDTVNMNCEEEIMQNQQYKTSIGNFLHELENILTKFNEGDKRKKAANPKTIKALQDYYVKKEKDEWFENTAKHLVRAGYNLEEIAIEMNVEHTYEVIQINHYLKNYENEVKRERAMV